MSKFSKIAQENTDLTVNHMNNVAFRLSPEVELVSILLTSFSQDSYYRSEGDTHNRLKEVLTNVDAEFAAKAAIYARTEFGMRSISHVLAAELAAKAAGQAWASTFYNKIVHRADDMTEIMAYYLTQKGGKLPNALRKGFATAFGRFDGYQLAKYRGEGNAVKLVDVVNLIHPTPNDKNREALKALVAGELRNTDTWESALSNAGKVANNEDEKAELKAEAWEKLISTRKLGYFALLRNLRNIVEQASPEVLDAALSMLTDVRLLQKSLVLPFRFLSAYSEIEKMVDSKVFEQDRVKVQKVLSAIEKAATLAIENLPVLAGKTIVLSDNSGSMNGDAGGHSLVSKMSSTKTSSIANLFAVMYWLKAENTLVGLFGDRLIYPDLDRNKGLFDNFKTIDTEKNKCGGATERGIFDMFERLVKEKIMADTIVIFSDTQIGDACGWYDNSGNRGGQFMDLFKKYRAMNPTANIYSVDLKGYGTTVFDGSVVKIAGWSEKIFDIMAKSATDKDAMVNEIRAVSWN
jgi:60 kDa SS-A/Ro ribonucleoprotein